MNRKQFILSKGATCANWMWSWSFIDHNDMKVIFGAWDTEAGEEREVILRDSWKSITRDGKQRRQPGYVQALEHLEYVKQGYELYTFVMGHSLSEYSEDISRIKKFSHHLQLRYLVQEEGVWYACREAQYLPEELSASASYSEGAKTQILVNAYERDPAARKACLQHHGYRCQGCGFSFEEFYGKAGRNFIHVHHRIPLHTVGENYRPDPVNDMVPLCPNCHAMVHRSTPPMETDALKEIIACAGLNRKAGQ
ncbi:HNH endonuclease [Erwiniaceae bacterium L1_55_4]|nr:HNH endonuclease [Erwiniaceae bacterium L1_55_4]